MQSVSAISRHLRALAGGILRLRGVEGVKAADLTWGKVVLAHRGQLTRYTMLAMELLGRGCE